jgi:hypothetical protein
MRGEDRWDRKTHIRDTGVWGAREKRKRNPREQPGMAVPQERWLDEVRGQKRQLSCRTSKAPASEGGRYNGGGGTFGGDCA